MLTAFELFDLFGKPVLAYVCSKVTGKLKKEFKGYKKDKRRNLFINQIDTNLLNKLGNKTYFNELSKAVFNKKILEKIFDLSYDSSSARYQTSSELIDYLISECEFDSLIESEIRQMLQNILNASFNMLNSPDSDEMRKMHNVVNRAHTTQMKAMANIDGQLKEIRATLDDMKTKPERGSNVSEVIETTNSFEYHASPVLLYAAKNKNKFKIVLQRRDSNTSLVVKMAVKHIGLISKFDLAEQYLSYLLFLGEDDELDVVSVRVLDKETEESLFYYESSYEGPSIKMPDYDVRAMDISTLDNKDVEEFKVKIIPPKQTVKVAIQDECYNPLIRGVEFTIKREHLSSVSHVVNFVEANPTRGFSLRISLKYSTEGGFTRLSPPKITIKNESEGSAVGWHNFYRFFFALASSSKLIFRNEEDDRILVEGSYIAEEGLVDFIEQQIELYSQLICIQDYFGVGFAIPNQIDYGTESMIRLVYETINKPKVLLHNYMFAFKKEETSEVGEFRRCNRIRFFAELTSVPLLGENLPVSGLSLVVLDGVLDKETDDAYEFMATSSYIVKKAAYPGLVCHDLADALIAEESRT